MKGKRLIAGRWQWAVSLATLACAGTSHESNAPDSTSIARRDTRILHEECAVNDSDAVGEDVNGDGRPDRTTVRRGRVEICRAVDFNFDGVIDSWVYLDSEGRLRRQENDYDRDGRVDEVALYQGGQLTERQRATTLAGKLDTWHFYEAGKVSRTERDSNGDDYVDQWWEYPAGRQAECPLIHSDVDGDGRPDPGATVDVCSERYTPAPRDSAPGEGAEDASDSVGELPVETEGPADDSADDADESEEEP
jgi:hypothetical protein